MPARINYCFSLLFFIIVFHYCFIEDPTAKFHYPRSCPDAVLKFLTDIFSSRDTSEFFYSSDMKILIEIVLRQLANLSPGAGVCHNCRFVCYCSSLYFQARPGGGGGGGNGILIYPIFFA